MIRLDSISRQNGQQLLFVDASAALQRGEKVGLVGPNGAGKTTMFRMITGQEKPDEGQVLVDRGVSIGFFDQDVGEMSGRTPVSSSRDEPLNNDTFPAPLPAIALPYELSLLDNLFLNPMSTHIKASDYTDGSRKGQTRMPQIRCDQSLNSIQALELVMSKCQAACACIQYI